MPQVVYWGGLLKLSEDEQQQLLTQLIRPVPQAFLDEDVPLTLVPLWGNGWFQLNALAGSSVAGKQLGSHNLKDYFS